MNKVLVGIVVLGLGVVVGWYLLEEPQSQPQEDTTQTETQVPTLAVGGLQETPGSTASGDAMEKGGVATRMVVTYSDTGFAPEPLTVKVGTIVTFMNESTKSMWVASGVHPTHQLLPGFDQLKSVGKGGSYEYTFAKVGTWRYHNHMIPTEGGSVVVTE